MTNLIQKNNFDPEFQLDLQLDPKNNFTQKFNLIQKIILTHKFNLIQNIFDIEINLFINSILPFNPF